MNLNHDHLLCPTHPLPATSNSKYSAVHPLTWTSALGQVLGEGKNNMHTFLPGFFLSAVATSLQALCWSTRDLVRGHCMTGAGAGSGPSS